MSVAEPFPQASENLEKGFRKALKAYESETPATTRLMRKEEQAVKDLITLFVRLHAKCYTAREWVICPHSCLVISLIKIL